MAGFISSRSSTNFKLIKGELTGTTNEAVEWLNDSTLSDHYVINNWLSLADKAVTEGEELPSRPNLTGLSLEALQLLWPEN